MSKILCLFTFEGEVKFTPGTITSSNLICDPLKFEYSDANLPIVTAVFTVTAGENSLALDNPQNIRGKDKMSCFIPTITDFLKISLESLYLISLESLNP